MPLSSKNMLFGSLMENFILPKDKNILKCDIYEKDEMCFVDIDMPGFIKDEIKITYKNGYLCIVASKEEQEDKDYVLKERTSSYMEREIYVGAIKEETIEASLKDGVLSICAEKIPLETHKIVVK